MVRALTSLAGPQGSLAQRMPRSVAGVMSSLANAGGLGVPAIGQSEFITPGTYAWTVPAGVTSISAVTVGGGAAGTSGSGYPDGGAGGGLSYANSIPVTPGEELTVVVGTGGDGLGSRAGGASMVQRSGVDLVSVSGGSTNRNVPGLPIVGTGFSGGVGGADRAKNSPNGWGSMRAGGGGGAGGYSGNGGAGGNAQNVSLGSIPGASGTGGSGAGGAGDDLYESTSNHGGGSGKAGGGVGIYGEGASGVGATYSNGTGGSGGADGFTSGVQSHGGDFGAGGGGGRRVVYDDRYSAAEGGNGGGGAVRMIWPGTERLFPATRTADEIQE